MKLKLLFQNLKAVFFLSILLFTAKQTGAQCTYKSPPFTQNTVQVTKSWTGKVYTTSPILTHSNACIGFNMNLIVADQLGNTLTSGWGPFTYTINFSAPVNNVELIMIYLDGNEKFKFTTNAANTTLTVLNTCNPPIKILDTLKATSNGNDFKVRISAPTPYTSIIVSGPGGNGGSSLLLCAESIQAAPNPCTVYPLSTITPSGAITFCQGGSVNLVGYTGAPNLTYQWKRNGVDIVGATASTYTATQAGTYTVNTTNSNGCSTLSSETVVTVNPIPTIATGTITNATSCVSANGSVRITGTGGGIISWTGPSSGTSGTITLPYTVTNLGAGTYTFQLTTNGCVSSAVQATIAGPANQMSTISPSSAQSICSGGSVTFNANTGSGLSYVWKNNNVNISGATSSSYTATNAGSYSVVVTNANGCSGTAGPVSVSLITFNPPTLTIGTATTFCAGGSVVMGTPTIAGYSYQWKLNNVNIANAISSSYTATASGNYALQVTNAQGCTAITTAVPVTVNPKPTLTTGAISNATSCIVVNGSVQFTGLGSGTIAWTGTTTGNSGTINLPYTQTNLGAGTYSFTLTSNGCTSNSVPVTIGGPTAQAATISPSSAQSICSGGSVTFSANTGTGLSYVWRNNNVPIANATSSTYTATIAGTYSVVVTNANGCSGTAGPVSVSLITFNPPTLTIGSSTTFCAGGSVVMGTPTIAGYSYQWKLNNVNIANATSSSYTATASGNYALQVTNAQGCTAITTAVPVTVNPKPTLTTGAISNATSCVVVNGSVQFTGLGSGTIAWTGTTTGNSGTINLPYTQTNLGAGTYNFTLTSNGCTSASVPVTIAGPAAQTAFLSPAGPISICTGNSTLLSANPGAGLTYVWKNNNMVIPNATANTYTATAAGSYSVTVTNAAGCAGTAGPVTISLNSFTAPTITAASTTAICPGGSVVLSTPIVAGSTYQWLLNGVNIPAATSASYTATAAGSYSLFVTNAAGCTGTTNAISVTVTTAPVLAVGTTTNSTSCLTPNGSVQFTGTGTGVIKWTGSASGSTATITLPYTLTTLNAGSYSFTFITSSGCSSNSVPVTISGPLAPLAEITNTGSLSFCAGSTLVLTATIGTNLSYQWKTGSTIISGATSSSYTTDEAGTYTVTIKDNISGCTATSTGAIVTTITVSQPTITAATALNFCTGGSVTLNANPTSGYTYQWYLNNSALTGATAATYNATATGSYSVKITAGNCSATSTSVPVTANPLPEPTISPVGTSNICTGGNLALTATGGGTYQWKLNGTNITGATASSYIATQEGKYTVEVKNNFNCIATSAVATLQVNSAPSITSQATGAQTMCQNGTLTALSVNVSGTGNTFQWYSSPIASSNGGSAIAGATSSTFTPNTSNIGTYYFYCVISNICGTSITAPVSGAITIVPPVAISSQVTTTQKVCEGTSFTALSVTATGANLSYQWYSNTSASTTGGTAISGATSSTYTPSSTIGGTLYYYCIVTDACGTAKTTAISEAMITTSFATVTFDEKPSVCKGSDYVVELSGTANASIQYTLDGTLKQITCDATGKASIPLLNVATSTTIQINTITTSTAPVCMKVINKMIQLTALEAPEQVVVEGKTDYCAGETMEALQVTNAKGQELHWYSDAAMTQEVATAMSFTPEAKTGTLYITTKNASGCVSKPTTTEILINDCNVPIYNAYTPDGDVTNDSWELKSIDKNYPKNVVSIYNRWGSLIFESEPGQYEKKPWDGKFGGEILPVGTYYYSIQFNDEHSKKKHGTVTLIKK